jgi:hypothetical protein
MTKKAPSPRIALTREAITAAATDVSQIAIRVELAAYVSQLFAQVGTLLHLSGNIIGPDRKAGTSPFDHGSDETVAVSLLLQIASQLLSASTDLFQDGRSYAAAALVRQMVEVEYLAWAFETRDHDAERWLRSNERERQDFFRPPSFGRLLEDDFEIRIMGITASWAAILSQCQKSCFGVIQPRLNCFCLIYWATPGASGTTSWVGLWRKRKPSSLIEPRKWHQNSANGSRKICL